MNGVFLTEGFMMGVFLFMIGAIVGSFLNVCIVRMPKEQSIVFPGSHCTHCKHPIQWFHNIPIFSYILLKGQCPYCKAGFSFRYCAVELLTALIFVGMYWHYGTSPVLIPYLFMVCCFIVATFVDFGHRIIPDEISVGGMFAGLVFSLFIPELHHVTGQYEHWIVPHLISLWKSLLGVLIGGGVIYAMGVLGDFLFKKESMGGGDVKLLAMIGAFLGWQMALLTFFIAPFFGAVYGIIEKIRTKDTAIAYGPFLILGALMCMLKGQEILAWVMSGYGLY